MTDHARRTKLLAALTTAIVLLVAGLVSADAQSPAPLTKLTVGMVAGTSDLAAIYVASQQGLFKKAGLDVELQKMSGGDTAGFAALASGSVDVLAAGSLDYLQAISKKAVAAKMFGEILDSNTDVVVGKNITSWSQLKGKVIGTSGFGAGDNLYMRAMLANAGLSPDADVTWVVAGPAVTRLAALSAGRIDATAQGNSNRVQSQAVGNVLVKAEDSPLVVPNIMLGANTTYIASHKPQLRSFLSALGEAVDWIRANPTQAVPACTAASGADDKTCASIINADIDPAQHSKYTWSPNFAVNADGVKGAMIVAAIADPTVKSLSFDDVADTSVAAPLQ